MFSERLSKTGLPSRLQRDGTRVRRELSPWVRGQEAAPFEMMVGIVLLGFVLITGVLVLSQSTKSQCEQQAKELVGQLKSDFEGLFSNESSKRISVEIPSCFDKKPSISIRKLNNRTACGQFCLGSNYSCNVLSFSSEQFTETVCLRIPPEANIAFKQPGQNFATECPVAPQGNFEGFPFGFDTDLNSGEYFFSRKNVSGNAEVCSFQLKQPA